MAYVIKDIRVEVLHELRKIRGGRVAFLSGLLTGLKMQEHLMKKYGSTTYESGVVDYIAERFHADLPDVVLEYNRDDQHEMKLDYQCVVGSAQRQSRFGDHWYEGMRLGMDYVAGLYYSFDYENIDKAGAISNARKYLESVIEWSEEELQLRSHVH